MTSEHANTQTKVLQRLGVSQLQCDLRALFRVDSPARAMLRGLAHIAEYLGADYLVVHARIGTTFLSEEFSEGFEPSDELRDVVNAAMSDVMGEAQARCVRLRTKSDGDDGPTVIAALLHDEDNEPAGAAAILLQSCDRERAVEVFSAFESILGFVSVLVSQRTSQTREQRAAADDAALVAEIDASDPVKLAFFIAGSLANRHGLDQVAVGLIDKKRVRIAAVSGMDEVRLSNPGVKCARDAMEEGLDAEEPIVFTSDHELELAPHSDYPLHRQWSSASGGDTVATFPMKSGERVVGMVAVRQAAGSALQHKNLEAFQEELLPYARLLPLAQRAGRGVVRHVVDSACSSFGRFAGTTVRRCAVTVAVVCMLACWLAFGTLSHSVVVHGRLVPSATQRITSPQDGTLREVAVRVGDYVEAGAVLAVLDTRLDELEAAELQARIRAKEIEADRALAESTAVERQVIDSQRRALVAELAIVRARIDAGVIRAAVAGVVVAGDPRDLVGYPLQAGHELFQLAERNQVRLVMRVPEQSIVQAREAKGAEFVLAARPDAPLDVAALRFPPTATPTDEGMVFEVETKLVVDESSGVLLPGMEGVAYLDLGSRNAWWVLTHRVTDWLRLRFWI